MDRIQPAKALPLVQTLAGEGAPAWAVDDDGPVWMRLPAELAEALDEPAEPFLAFAQSRLGALALRDVAHRPLHAPEVTSRAGIDPTLRPNPPEFAVRAPDSTLEVPRPVRGDGVLEAGVD